MNSCCRSETLPEDLTQQIRHYIQTKTKREFALVLVMLKNTSYTAWECLEQQSIGIDWYEWQSKGCPIHGNIWVNSYVIGTHLSRYLSLKILL